jgi:AcrR family transcriptional regulator
VPESVKRPYRSAVREAQARATRRAVVEAASRLFVEAGYVATSIDAIGVASGVSRRTVFATGGGKAALLKAAYDLALGGDHDAVPFGERPRSRQVQAEPDPARHLDLYAELCTEVGTRLAPIYEAVRGAASADPEVREVFQGIEIERRVGAGRVVQNQMRRGPLRDGLKPKAAADIVWVLNDPGLFHALVHRAGWTADEFRKWLSKTMQQQLLP